MVKNEVNYEVYTYVILYIPSEEKTFPKIIVNPTTIVAESKESATLQAHLSIPDEYKTFEKIANLKVLVKAF